MILKKRTKAIAILAILLGSASCATQGSLDAKGNPRADVPAPPGKFVEYDGGRFHVFATGEGPSVLFISGSSDPCPYVTFYPLWQELGKTNRCIVFDRPGYGWSEDRIDSADIDYAVDRMLNAIALCGEKGPFTVLAVSMGGLEAIRLEQSHPELVRGIVMIDPGTPLSYLTMKQFSDTNLKKTIKQLQGYRRLRDAGLFRIYPIRPSMPQLYDALPDEMKKMLRDRMNHAYASDSNIEEARALTANARKILRDASLSDTPLVYLTAGKDGINGLRKSQQDYFSTFFPNSIEIFKDDAPHAFHWKYPALVIEKVRELSVGH
jgi:pimeloyl-ACP methyl ester carboxylesterase